MVMLAIQTFLLIAIAYILGCVIGCILHQIFGAETVQKVSTSAEMDAKSAVATPTPIKTQVAEAEHKPVKATPKPQEQIKKKPAKPKVVQKPKTVSADLGDDLIVDSNDEKAAAADKLGTRPPALKAARGGQADDLKMIKGIGQQNEGRLNALGTYHFDQIASWNKKQCEWVGSYLAFKGRIEREEWVKQAKVLAKGGATEFSKRAASGKVASSSGKAAKIDTNFAGKKPRVMKQARKSGADKLTKIDGVGNAIEKRLFDLGIYHFDQIAKWTPENEAWIGNQIGFPGRVERENWVKAAKILADK